MDNKTSKGTNKTMVVLIILFIIFIWAIVNSISVSSKYDKLKNQYESLQNEYNTIEKENIQLTSKNEKLQNDYETIQKFYTDIKDKYNSLIQYNIDKISDLEEAKKEMLELQSKQQEQDRILGILQTTPTNIAIDELLTLYDANDDQYDSLNNTHVVLTAYVKTEYTPGSVDKQIHVDDKEMQSFFGSEITFLDTEDDSTLQSLKRYDLVVIDGIADTSGATFKMNNCQLKQWTKSYEVEETQENGQNSYSSNQTFVESYNSADYTDSGASYQYEVQASELLKMSENKNFDDVPFNGATAEIYNKYNGKIIKITGTVQDIQGNCIYLDCDDDGYNTVGANTTSVVYYVAKNPQDFSVGSQIQAVGKAYCYTQAIVIK